MAFRSICTNFAAGKHRHGLSLVPLWHERKVRAAQDTPLVKVQAVGDGWIWQKKITALSSGLWLWKKGKGEKVV